MSLFISINTASSELAKSPIDDAITFLATHVAIEKRQGQFPSGPALDITFMLPGKHDAPNFKGMRMGGYTEENGTLFFETSVPFHIVKSTAASRYVATVMQDVLHHAQEYFQEHEIDFDANQWHRTIERIVQVETVSETTH